MSNKINNPFGAGNAGLFNPEQKRGERSTASKGFGEFLEIDERDQSSSGEAENLENGALGEGLFGSVFGKIGQQGDEPGRNDSDERDNRRNTSNTRRNNNEPIEEDYKPGQKPVQKPKRAIAKGFEKDFPPEEEKLKETKPESSTLAPFQVPLQVDTIRPIAPVEKPTTIIPTKMIDQIVQEVRLGINARGEVEFQFDLKSEVLDGLKLKISTKDGQVSASFIAENVHVKDTIDQGAQELVKALQARGLEVAELQVSVGANMAGSGQGQQQNQQQGQQQSFYTSQADYGRTGDSTTGGNAAESEQPSVTRSNTNYTI
ncbi:MAG: flagellar hook-length control protein FliK [Acidobacteriota bacterium]